MLSLATLFRFMADTLKVKNPATEQTITTFPKTYDFEDFWVRQDYRKMFVSKLLKTGTGQCHSLPLLFLLLAEEIQAKANLAFAPNHSFIKFQDRFGRWYNIELTAGVFASDHFMIESGYIKAEALRNHIYLEPLTTKQVVVQCLNDLNSGYLRTYGYDKFVLECSNKAIAYEPSSLTGLQLRSNYYNSLIEFIAGQYARQPWRQADLKSDGRAMEINNRAEEAVKKIENLGYSDMPHEAYEAWLNACKSEAAKQEHSNQVIILKGMIQR